MANLLRPSMLLRSKPLTFGFRRSFSTSYSVRSVDDDSSFSIEGNDSKTYERFKSSRADFLQERLQDPKRFEPISVREERSVLSLETVKCIMAGKYFSLYRGIEMLKGPEDLAILYQMLWHIKPRTVIEIGAFTGGSALWIADNLNTSNIECNVFSTDIDLSLLHPLTKAAQPPNLTFIECENSRIEKFLSSDFLKKLPHPFIIIEDSHVHFDKAMGHLHHHTVPGDYIVCEDTSPDIPITALDKDTVYTPLGLTKLHSWKQFLAKHGDTYAIDTYFCDLFGYNGSSNWDGYARRMK